MADAKRTPDEATQKRIASLAVVGRALMQRSNDNTFETDFTVAREALDDFEKGIGELDLEPASEEGMKRLIEYLRGKVQKRLDSYINMTPLE